MLTGSATVARHLCRSIALLLLWWSGVAVGAEPAATDDEALLETPAVLLKGVPFEVRVGVGPAGETRVLMLDGVPQAAAADGVYGDLMVQDTGAAVIELRGAAGVLEQRTLDVIPGWVSLLPPIAAIVLAFLLRSVIPALFVGILAGAWAINGLSWYGAFTGFFETFTVYTLEAAIDPDHAKILLFGFMIGGMIGIVSRNGGMLGVVNLFLPLANTPKRAQTIVGGLGVAVFFDDYANTLIVGNTTRPLTDRLGISREKLAYIVDATAAPVSAVAVITTWIGFQVGLIDDAVRGIDGLTTTAYALFINSLAYSFYSFLAVFFVFVVALSGRDFGPMRAAELRARARDRAGIASDQPALTLSGFDAKEGAPARAYNALVPIVTLVAGVIVGLYVSGEGETMQEIIGSADSYAALMWASLVSAMVAAVMSVGGRVLTLNEAVDAWVTGAQFMLTGLMLLVLAWAIADVADILQTAPYLITVLGDSLAPATLPAIVFVVAAGTAFATGTSWGVMAIFLPLAVPLCWAVLEANGMTTPEHMHIFYSCIASVMTGAVWADHCSPISDTTVLSSIATGCDHMEHVRTQLPYALLGGVVSLVLGVLPAGFGVPWWLLMFVCAAVLVVAHRVIGRPV